MSPFSESKKEIVKKIQLRELSIWNLLWLSKAHTNRLDVTLQGFQAFLHFFGNPAVHFRRIASFYKTIRATSRQRVIKYSPYNIRKLPIQKTKAQFPENKISPACKG